MEAPGKQGPEHIYAVADNEQEMSQAQVVSCVPRGQFAKLGETAGDRALRASRRKFHWDEEPAWPSGSPELGPGTGQPRVLFRGDTAAWTPAWLPPAPHSPGHQGQARPHSRVWRECTGRGTGWAALGPSL